MKTHILLVHVGRILLTIAALLGATALTHGQAHTARYTLSGLVRDTNGELLSGVSIHVAGKQQALTNAQGRYRLSLTAGHHTVTFSYLGFETQKQHLRISGDRSLDIELSETLHALPTVQVEAKSARDRMRHKAYSAHSVDIQSIAGSTQSVTQLLRSVSGVHVREQGGVGSDFNLSINGLSGNAIRYFIDGVPLSSLGSEMNLSRIPIAMIDRVDMYKGVVPADLGGDALGGAVNIITKRHQRSYADLSLSAGSFGTYRGDLNGRFLDPKSGFVASASIGAVTARNDYMMKDVEVWNKEKYEYQTGNYRRFHDGYRSLIGQAEIGITRRPWADEWVVGISGSLEHKEIQTGLRQDVVIGDAHREAKTWAFHTRYRKQSIAGLPLSLQVAASRSHDHRMLVDTTFRLYSWDKSWVPISFSEVRGRDKSIRLSYRPVWMVRANLSYLLSAQQSLSFNYQFQNSGNRLSDRYDLEFLPTDDYMSKHIFGLTYNAQLLSDRLHLFAFAKEYLFTTQVNNRELSWLTHIDKALQGTRNNHGYGGGVRYTLHEGAALKASYEHSYRLPIARELLGNGDNITPNYALRPESAHNINLGAYGSWHAGGHRVGYELSTFARSVRDYILRVTINERQAQYDNVYDATVWGAEGELTYDYLRRWRATLNATYLNERNKSKTLPTGMPNVVYNDRMPNRPWFFTSLDLSHTRPTPFGLKGHSLRFSLNTKYVHWYYLNWASLGLESTKARIPTQWSADAVATWSWQEERYSLALECLNLFDNKLYDNYRLQRPSRGFYLKLRATLH